MCRVCYKEFVLKCEISCLDRFEIEALVRYKACSISILILSQQLSFKSHVQELDLISLFHFFLVFHFVLPFLLARAVPT